jgi:maleate isomerase
VSTRLSPTGPAGMEIGRRHFMGGLAALPVNLLPDRAAAAPAKGHIVGCVKPLPPPPVGKADESMNDLGKLLPPNISLLPIYMSLTKGTKEEMKNSIETYRSNIALLAEKHCDLISVEGAPPFMLLGRNRETALVSDWETTYRVPMFTSSQNQINVFRAVKARKIFGVTEFTGKINETYADYFRSAGIEVVAMDGMPGISFDKLDAVASPQVHNFITSHFRLHERADAVYMLGSAWHTLDIVEPLERDLGVPVIHPIAARAWEIQKRLGIHLPVRGYGTLMATLPA